MGQRICTFNADLKPSILVTEPPCILIISAKSAFLQPLLHIACLQKNGYNKQQLMFY